MLRGKRHGILDWNHLVQGRKS